jgi:flagellin-specific chaperone FliS
MVLIFPYATKHYEKNEKNSLSQIYTMIHISSSLKETWRKIELSEIKNYNRRATVVNW